MSIPEEIQRYTQLEEREMRNPKKRGRKRHKKMAMTVKGDDSRNVEVMSSSRGNPFHAAPSCRDAIFAPVWLLYITDFIKRARKNSLQLVLDTVLPLSSVTLSMTLSNEFTSGVNPLSFIFTRPLQRPISARAVLLCIHAATGSGDVPITTNSDCLINSWMGGSK